MKHVLIVVLSFFIMSCDSVEDAIEGDQCEAPDPDVAMSTCTNQPETLQFCTNGSETEAWWVWNGSRFDCSDEQCLQNVAELVNACNNFDISTQSAVVSITITADIPEQILTSQRASSTIATLSGTTGTFPMVRNGDQFASSIDIEAGSQFSFSLVISESIFSENFSREEVTYATSFGAIDGAIFESVTITLNSNDFVFLDDDQDGANNLTEIEAGSNHANSFSTPANPDGVPSPETVPGQLQFTASTFTVAEADRQLIIPVTRTGGSDGRVSVQFITSNETAIRGLDYDARLGELIWEDGDSTPQNIDITILLDDFNEGTETFSASLISSTGGADIGLRNARITITE